MEFPASCPGEGECPFGTRETGKSWRAHREIKGYAGSGGDRIAADEREHTTGRGAADKSPAPDQPNGSDGTATGGDRHDGDSRAATGSGAEADRAAVPAEYERRLHEAEEPLLASACALHSDECS